MESSEEQNIAVKQIWIDWNAAAEQTSVRHVNQVIVQSHDHEFYISFFNFSPPLLFGAIEDRVRQSEEIEALRPDCIARINLTPRLLRETIKALQSNLEKYEASKENDDETAI